MACVALERMQSPRLLEFAERLMPNRANGIDKAEWALFNLPRRIARNDTDAMRSARYRVSVQADISGPLATGDMQDYYHYTVPFFTDATRLYKAPGIASPLVDDLRRGVTGASLWPIMYDIYGPGMPLGGRLLGWKAANGPPDRELNRVPVLETASVDTNLLATIAGKVLFERTLPALVGEFGQRLSIELGQRLPAVLPSVDNAVTADKWPPRVPTACSGEDVDMPEEERAQILRFLLPFDEVGAPPGEDTEQERSRIAILHDLHAYCGLPRAAEAANALRIASFCPLATVAYHMDYIHQVFVDDSAHRRSVDDYRRAVLRLEERIVEIQFPRVSATSAAHFLETIRETHVFTGAEISDPMIAGRIYLKPAALTLLAAGSADLQKWGWGHVRLEQVTSLPLRQGESPSRQSIAMEFAQWLATRYMRIQLDFPEVYKTALQRIESINLQQARQRQCWQMLAQFFGPPDSTGEAASMTFSFRGSGYGTHSLLTTTLIEQQHPHATASWTLKLLS